MAITHALVMTSVLRSQDPVLHAAEELQQKAMMFVTGALTVNLIGLGDELGLYKALKAHGGPMTPLELAHATNTHERWIREWLYQQVSCSTAPPGPVSSMGLRIC